MSDYESMQKPAGHCDECGEPVWDARQLPVCDECNTEPGPCESVDRQCRQGDCESCPVAA